MIDEPTFPGCERLLGVPQTPMNKPEISRLRFEPLERLGPEKAEEMLDAAIERRPRQRGG